LLLHAFANHLSTAVGGAWFKRADLPIESSGSAVRDTWRCSRLGDARLKEIRRLNV
jgi:hypothetical protein